MAVHRKPLLAPGNKARWAEINREEAKQRRALDMALTPAQRLAKGQELSQQAASLLAASKALHGELPEEPIPGVD